MKYDWNPGPQNSDLSIRYYLVGFFELYAFIILTSTLVLGIN